MLKFSNRFKEASCHLEVLRHCHSSHVQRTLEELPESLYEIYGRILRDIKKPNRGHAHRILQCLFVAVRPLRVEELGEVLAVDFDDSEGIAKLNPSWRWEDEEQALLSSCSSLIAIEKLDDSRVVQFSHPSAKEFLTSPQFAAAGGDLSRYRIALEPAHTIMARACLAVLLRPGDTTKNGARRVSPLAGYAAQHWVSHAQFENVSSQLLNTMKVLFDQDQRYFKAWLELHDMDTFPEHASPFFLFCPSQKSAAAPLYYATLCGFYDLAEHLITNYPRQVNDHGGYHVVPLVAALAGKPRGIARLLVRNGAGTTVNVRGSHKRTPLHSAAYYGHVEVVRFLLDHNANVKSKDSMGRTPLHNVPGGGGGGSSEGPHVRSQLADVARLLLQHGADVNARQKDNRTPLHVAANYGALEVARVLLEYGAAEDKKDKEGRTAYQVASGRQNHGVMKFLLEYGGRSSDLQWVGQPARLEGTGAHEYGYGAVPGEDERQRHGELPRPQNTSPEALMTRAIPSVPASTSTPMPQTSLMAPPAMQPYIEHDAGDPWVALGSYHAPTHQHHIIYDKDTG